MKAAPWIERISEGLEDYSALVFEPLARGEEVYFRQEKLPAKVIERICREKEANLPSGLRIRDAQIKGDISLLDAKVPFRLQFRNCKFVKPEEGGWALLDLSGGEFRDVDLTGSKLGRLNLSGGQFRHMDLTRSELDRLNADGINCHGDVVLSRVNVRRGVSLQRAHIGGRFLGNYAELGGTHYEVKLNNATDVTEIPDAGEAMMIVSNLASGSQLHFRTFDLAGNMILNKSEKEIPGKLREIDKLRQALAGSWDPASAPFNQEKIRELVTAITGHPQDGGAFDADGIDVKGELNLSHLNAKGEVWLQNAKVGLQLILDGANLKKSDRSNALTAPGVQIGNDFTFRDGFRARGGVRFPGARIAGDLICRDAEFRTASSSPAFSAARITVGGKVDFHKIQAKGEVRLEDANVGELNCKRADFDNPEGVGFNAKNVDVKGNFEFRDLNSRGQVLLDGVTARGDLRLICITVTHEGKDSGSTEGQALRADGINVTGDVWLKDGCYRNVWMADATIGGDLRFMGTKLISEERNTSASHELAVNANNITVSGDLRFEREFETKGEVRMRKAAILGDFVCDGAVWSNNSGHALFAPRIQVGGDFSLKHVQVTSKAVDLTKEGGFAAIGARFSGDVDLNDVLEETAVQLDDATINGTLRLNLEAIKHGLNLRQTGVERLEIEGSFSGSDGKSPNEPKFQLRGLQFNDICFGGRPSPRMLRVELNQILRFIIGLFVGGAVGAFATSALWGVVIGGLLLGFFFAIWNVYPPNRRLVVHQPAAFLSDVLEGVDFDRGPYLYMEGWLRQRGRSEEANAVYLLMQKKELSFLCRTRPVTGIGKRILSWVAGDGIKPQRLIPLWLFLLLLAGAIFQSPDSVEIPERGSRVGNHWTSPKEEDWKMTGPPAMAMRLGVPLVPQFYWREAMPSRHTWKTIPGVRWQISYDLAATILEISNWFLVSVFLVSLSGIAKTGAPSAFVGALRSKRPI